MGNGISRNERKELVRAILIGVPTVMFAIALKSGLTELLPQLNDWKTQAVVFGVILILVYYFTDK